VNRTEAGGDGMAGQGHRGRRAQVATGYASTPRETLRQTYHIEKPFIRMIHREAESEGISITEVVNRAFRAYFERGR
jgi:hypothetical protein